MDRLDSQMIKSLLAEMESRIEPNVAGPTAQASISMSKQLLAFMLVRHGSPAASLHPPTGGEWQAVLPASRTWPDVLVEVEKEARRLGEMEAAEIAAASAGVTVCGRDAMTPESLTSYVRERLENGKDARVTEVCQSLGGYSKETYIVRLSGVPGGEDAIVIRRDPDGGSVERLAAEELPILRTAFCHGVPVPEPLWADREAPFGRSVVVTRFVPGRSVYDLTGLSLDPGSAPTALILARVLATLHTIPVSAIDDPSVQAGSSIETHVAYLVDALEDQWKRRCLWISPTIEAAFAWMRANIPHRPVKPAIVHGDASFRNLLVHDNRATALLDWELWHIGDPVEDLAYCRPEIEELGVWSEFMDEYRAHGGGPFDAVAGEFYGLWRALRNAVLSGCCGHGFAAAGQPEARMAFAGTFLYRRFVCEVAERLAAIERREG